jgi:hypothetical protein
MPPTLRDKGDSSTTVPRPPARKRNGSLSTPDELQEIKTVLDGRKYLERFSLLCPPGEPATVASLSMCLHQVAAMAGLSKQAINAVRATALLLEEIEENSVNETVKNAFDSQINEFASDMKSLVDDVQTKIDEHVKAAMDQLAKAPVGAPASASTPFVPGSQSNPAGHGPASTYAAALINPPPHVNPKLAAREGVRARQFVLKGIKESGLGQHDSQQLKAELNKSAKELGLKEGRIRSVIIQRDGNTLIEVDSDIAAKWYANLNNRINLCGMIGEDVTFRARAFNVLAFNVPLTIDISDIKHVEEINEVNDLEDYSVTAIRWAKPTNRRSPQQKSAHLVLTFANPDAANRAISNGITICHKKCHVERIKREPIRCLKCQGWNHMARDCSETSSKCSNCAGEHNTADCPQPRTKRCLSCKTADHASWSRECPVFLRKVDEFNERNPENLLPFFPTADPWTWSTGNTNATNVDKRQSVPKTASKLTERTKTINNRDSPRPWDTYIPSYAQRPGQANQDPIPDDWWGDEPVGPPNSATRNSQPSKPNTFTFVNNSGNAGPSNLYPNSDLHLDA